MGPSGFRRWPTGPSTRRVAVIPGEVQETFPQPGHLRGAHFPSTPPDQTDHIGTGGLRRMVTLRRSVRCSSSIVASTIPAMSDKSSLDDSVSPSSPRKSGCDGNSLATAGVQTTLPVQITQSVQCALAPKTSGTHRNSARLGKESPVCKHGRDNHYASVDQTQTVSQGLVGCFIA